jgi:hypothetical protein
MLSFKFVFVLLVGLCRNELFLSTLSGCLDLFSNICNHLSLDAKITYKR